MAAKRPSLAKLSRPKIFGAMARERLFALLDRNLKRPCVWVSGPPGSGKTTLIASFLDARKLPGIWYQVDAGDNDVASFFHYLRIASARVCRRTREPLPTLASGHFVDLSGFSRRYFRNLYDRLPSSSVLVLDNYQEVASGSALHEVLSTAAEEVPEGINLMVLSRSSPPANFSRLLAGNLIAVLEWNALQLTREETRLIARTRGVVDPGAVATLHSRCAGWAVGLTLMLEQFRLVGTLDGLEHVENVETISDYFAQQVFGSVPAGTHDFLLRTSALPRMTAESACEISGQPEARHILDDLYRRRLFTERRPGRPSTYQYHALFRTFLLGRALDTFGPIEWTRIGRRAGQLLEKLNQPEDAIESFRSIQDWGSVIRLIRVCAPNLLAQSRWQTLREWIEGVPPSQAEGDAWLRYWYGMARIGTQPAQAREVLEISYELFTAAGDVEGRLRSTSAIIQARFLETVDHRFLDPWLHVHERLLDLANGACPAEVMLRAHSAMMIGTLYRQPGHPALKASVQQVLALLDTEIGTNEKLAAASFLLVYTGYTGDFETARLVIPQGLVLAQRPEASPMNRGTWFNWLGYNYFYSFETEAAFDALANAARIGEEEKLQPVTFVAAYFQGMLQRGRGHHELARKYLNQLQALVDGRSLIQKAVRSSLAGWLAVSVEGDPAQAIAHGRAAWILSRQLGSPSYLVHWGTPWIYGLIEHGQFDDALILLREQREALAGTAVRCYDPLFLCVEATIALRQGDEDGALALTSQMFATARAAGHGAYLTRLSPWMPRLCELALEHGIEADYVARLIRQAGWSPESQAATRWPWRWKILTLGRFELLRDDRPIRFGRKPPKRPLALLHSLIAAGPGGIPAHVVCDRLWPDHEADRARHSLEAAMHRLRRLLEDVDLVQLRHGRIRLDTNRAWVDAWAFGELMRSGVGEKSHAVSINRLKRAAEMYAGPFLHGNDETALALPARERLHDAFVSCIRRLGQHYEDIKDWPGAIESYRRGLELSDAVEAFYQGLMRCYASLGNRTDGIMAYKRMRESLAVSCGTLPSPDSEVLYRRLSAS